MIQDEISTTEPANCATSSSSTMLFQKFQMSLLFDHEQTEVQERNSAILIRKKEASLQKYK